MSVEQRDQKIFYLGGSHIRTVAMQVNKNTIARGVWENA